MEPAAAGFITATTKKLYDPIGTRIAAGTCDCTLLADLFAVQNGMSGSLRTMKSEALQRFRDGKGARCSQW